MADSNKRPFSEILEEYNKIKSVFHELQESLSRDINVLRHSNVYSDDVSLRLDKNIRAAVYNFEWMDKFINNMGKETWKDEDIMRLSSYVKTNMDINTYLAEDVSLLEKNLPIAQTIRTYLIKITDLLSRLCTAITNFITKTLPEKAKEAKSSFAASLGKLGESVKKLGTETPKKSGPGTSV